jgi:hypothetical protein
LNIHGPSGTDVLTILDLYVDSQAGLVHKGLGLEIAHDLDHAVSKGASLATFAATLLAGTAQGIPALRRWNAKCALPPLSFAATKTRDDLLHTNEAGGGADAIDGAASFVPHLEALIPRAWEVLRGRLVWSAGRPDEATTSHGHELVVTVRFIPVPGAVLGPMAHPALRLTAEAASLEAKPDGSGSSLRVSGSTSPTRFRASGG